jgi:hypothetical protein
VSESGGVGWRPDAELHRLMQLLMNMRALAQREPAPMTPWAPEKRSAAA